MNFLFNQNGCVLDNLAIKGRWHQIKHKLKERYTYLTDEDLNYDYGKSNEMIINL